MCERIQRRRAGPSRVAMLVVQASLMTACGLPRGATPVPAPAAWEHRMSGRSIVLLGEVHDNAELHALRLQALRRAVEAGWRPTVVLEQFDRERQPDIDRARRERPGDAQAIVDAAAPKAGGWDWALYRPVIALALAHDLPLMAGNLSGGDARRVVREGAAAVFTPQERGTLDLDRPRDAGWQAAHEREIEDGHCGALPATLLPAMARAQLARDAVLADTVRRAAKDGGVVLLAGNGHVRSDLGVPAWLPPALAPRLWVVGYLERPADGPAAPGTASGAATGPAPASSPASDAGRYDVVVQGTPAPRDDPCKAFRAPPPRP